MRVQLTCGECQDTSSGDHPFARRSSSVDCRQSHLQHRRTEPLHDSSISHVTRIVRRRKIILQQSKIPKTRSVQSSWWRSTHTHQASAAALDVTTTPPYCSKHTTSSLLPPLSLSASLLPFRLIKFGKQSCGRLANLYISHGHPRTDLATDQSRTLDHYGAATARTGLRPGRS